MKIDVPPGQTSYVLHDLETDVNYWVRVSANTRIGEGESTQIVTVMPVVKGIFNGYIYPKKPFLNINEVIVV